MKPVLETEKKSTVLGWKQIEKKHFPLSQGVKDLEKLTKVI